MLCAVYVCCDVHRLCTQVTADNGRLSFVDAGTVSRAAASTRAYLLAQRSINDNEAGHA